MSALRNLQRRAYRAFTSARPDALTRDLGSTRIPAAAGLAVYRNNFQATMAKALKASYPVTEQLVGDACFATLARDYRLAHPSRNGNLTRFGARFADLLSALYTDTDYHWLADVARLEWACQEVLLEADPATANLDWLASAGEDDLAMLRLQLHPATRLVSSVAPILTIWQAHQKPEVPTIDLSSGPEQVLVARVDGEVAMQPFAAGDWEFLAAIRNGASLGAAIALAADSASGFDPASTLQWLAVRGLVVSAVFDGTAADDSFHPKHME